jgi:hypothetical protein
MKALDEKIIELLCKDYRINEMENHCQASKSYIEKRIAELKDTYQVKTTHGLIYKYLQNE